MCLHVERPTPGPTPGSSRCPVGLVMLPFALALPTGLEAAAVVIVAQSLVEFLGMVAHLWCVPRVLAVRGTGASTGQ